jgi:hypothetical protein
MWMLSTRRRYAGSYAKSRSLILNQGTLAFGKVEQLDEAAFKSLGKGINAKFVEPQLVSFELLQREMGLTIAQFKCLQ